MKIRPYLAALALLFAFATLPTLATVADNGPRASYTATGGQTAFSYNFEILAQTDLKVYKNGTLLALSTNYTVSGVGNENGGTVTLTTGATAGDTIVIFRDQAISRTTDYQVGAKLNPDTLDLDLDRVVLGLQQTERDVNRALRLSDSDPAALINALPAASSRAGKFLSFDSSGQPSVSSTVTLQSASYVAVETIALLKALTGMVDGQVVTVACYYACTTPDGGGGPFRYDASSTDTPNDGTIVDPTASGAGRWERIYDGVTIDVRQFGAKGDGVEDDTAEFIAAAAAVTSGSTLYVPPGVYNLSSSTLASSQITIAASRVIIRGAGRDVSKIVLTGTSVVNSIFRTLSRDQIEVRDLWFYGNNQANAFANGIALSYTNSGASAAISGFNVHDNRFENFKGDFWTYVENISGAYAINDVRFNRNLCVSASGNSRGPTLTTVPQACVGVIAHNANAAGSVNKINIDDNVCHCTYMKGLALIFGNAYDWSINENKIFGAGTDAAFANDSASYAIMAYDNFMPPSRGTIANNIIDGVRDAGMYLQGVVDVTITGNFIRDQTSTADATIPKAAIAINGGTKVTATGNVIDTCVTGIVIHGSATSTATETVIAANTVRASSKQSILAEAVTTQSLNGVLIADNKLHASALRGIKVDIQSSTDSSDIAIRNNSISAVSIGIDVVSGDASYKLNDIDISGNEIRHSSGGTLTSHIAVISWTQPKVRIANNSLLGNATPAIDVRSTKKLTVVGNTFNDLTAGNYGFSSSDAEGVLWGNQYRNCASGTMVNTIGANDLGRLAPTFTGVKGMQVQNLNPVEAGAASSKYLITGWLYGTAWLEMRTLTGN